jgi:multidrug efflux pump subunit AcrB
MRAGDAHGEHREGRVLRAYTWFVGITMRVRYLTLIFAIGTLAVSIYFLMQVPGSFIPPEDVSRIPISVELPPGSTLEDTDRVTQRVYREVKDIDGVRDVSVLGGSSPTGDLDVRRAGVTVLLDPLEQSALYKLDTFARHLPLIGPLVPAVAPQGRIRPQSAIEAEVFAKLAKIPDIRAYKLNDRGERDVSYSILSNDQATLQLAAARLQEAARGNPSLADVSVAGALPRPEVQVVPRTDEAARLGVTTRAISDTLRVATIGDVDAALAKVSVDGRQVPVRVELGQDASDLARLAALRVPTAAGGTVPLNAVADIRIGQGQVKIERLNRERTITIGARNEPPSPTPSAEGSIPADMAIEVITIGRARLRPASSIASNRLSPRARISTAKSTSRMAFLVTMPISISTPIRTGIDSGLPVRISPPATPPMASGSENRMVKGWMTL